MSHESEAGPDWGSLTAHAGKLAGTRIADLFAREPDRLSRMSMETAGILLDASRNRIDAEGLALLLKLAGQCGLEDHIRALFAGDSVNSSEQRPALHWLVRDPGCKKFEVDGVDLMPGIRATLERMDDFCGALRTGAWRGAADKRITDVINVGIGGSDWGPRLVTQALAHHATDLLRVHFLANVDGHEVARLMETLAPESSLCIISSKSFSTPETLLNARTLAGWLGAANVSRQMVAVTANPQAAGEFGIPDSNLFLLWPWIGGRFSLWSAAGLAAGVALGMDVFRELLEGGAAMDAHFHDAPLAANMPVLLGLLDVWHRNGLGCEARALVSYGERLNAFLPWFQQLAMESGGKGVSEAGQAIPVPAAPVVFGGTGTQAQHTFMQAVHQGLDHIPVDLLGVIQPEHALDEHHRMLLTNLLAQAGALTHGETGDDPHRNVPGDRSCNVVLASRLTPRILGALLALFEHRVFVACTLWGVNAFDQFGVELGKRLAHNTQGDDLEGLDASLDALLERTRGR